MALFFLVVGLEIKREVVSGELRAPAGRDLADRGGDRRHAGPRPALPGDRGRRRERPRVGDPDGHRHRVRAGSAGAREQRMRSPSLKPLLLTLAIVDDIGAILVIALFYSGGHRVGAVDGRGRGGRRWHRVAERRAHMRVLLFYVVTRRGALVRDVSRQASTPRSRGWCWGCWRPRHRSSDRGRVSEEARRIADETSDDPDPADADGPSWMRLAWLSRGRSRRWRAPSTRCCRGRAS